MKPLSELDDTASETERGLAQLFSAAERYRPNPLRKRRTLVQVRLMLGARSKPLWQPAAVAALLVAGSAAAAVVGHHWLGNPSEQPPLVPQETSSVAKATHHGAEVEPALVAAPDNEPKVEETSPAPKAEAPLPRAPKAPVPKAAKPPAHTSKHAAAGEDPTRVVEALRALRKDGDPARAQSLLRQYMKANPRGALSEEALALTVEAAHARHDPKAKGYARRYLARYPSGRHTALARRVLAE